MMQLGRGALLFVLATSSCSGRREEDAAPSVASPSVAKAIDAPAIVAGVAGAWPDVPQGQTASGAIWQTVRHGTIHVHLALPPGIEPVKSSLEFGHPVVSVRAGDSTVQITYSSGGAQFGAGLAGDPPKLDSLPIERIARTPENTTILYRRGDEQVVLGWVRGAACKTEFLRPGDESAAFAVCESVRVPSPGPWERRTRMSGPLMPVPADAELSEEHGVALLYAGHYVAKIVNRVCPDEAELRDQLSPEMWVFQRRELPHGPVLVGRGSRKWDGATYDTATTAWATRGDHCCVASILEFFTPPTDVQVEDIARLCDETS
jgi:hypothetical protein